MKDVLSDKLNNFSKALIRLEEALNEVGYSLTLDGTIKRFEFTFEMAWKALKKFLLYNGIECTPVRDCIKKAYQSGFIVKEEAWLNMLKDRNLSSHIYDESEAEDIYKRIKEIYFEEFKSLEEGLIEKLKAAE